MPLSAGENKFIPLDMPILPEKLKELGYSTHLVGKWHLGAAYRNVTPTRRGFDSHFGYWNGYVGYFDYDSINPQVIMNTQTQHVFSSVLLEYEWCRLTRRIRTSYIWQICY